MLWGGSSAAGLGRLLTLTGSNECSKKKRETLEGNLLPSAREEDDL